MDISFLEPSYFQNNIYSERKWMSHPWPFIGVKWFFLEGMVEGKSAVTPLVSLDSNRAWLDL